LDDEFWILNGRGMNRQDAKEDKGRGILDDVILISKNLALLASWRFNDLHRLVGGS
jgi:hypothetical protein